MFFFMNVKLSESRIHLARLGLLNTAPVDQMNITISWIEFATKLAISLTRSSPKLKVFSTLYVSDTFFFVRILPCKIESQNSFRFKGRHKVSSSFGSLHSLNTTTLVNAKAALWNFDSNFSRYDRKPHCNIFPFPKFWANEWSFFQHHSCAICLF
jgi:predicted transcriptional regulator